MPGWVSTEIILKSAGKVPEKKELHGRARDPTSKATGATIWLSANFAPLWYLDALAETERSGPDSRRREIVFAICLAESYLFEWARRLLPDIEEVFDLFTFNGHRGIRERWKGVAKRLRDRRHIRAVPDFESPEWQAFCEIVDLRDGLVHGMASIPVSATKPKLQQPEPSPAELQELKPGEALRRVVVEIRRLNGAAGTEPPDWLG